MSRSNCAFSSGASGLGGVLSPSSVNSGITTPKSQRPLMNVGVGGADETLEQRMGLVRFAAEFGMELAGDEERVVWQLDYFDQVAVGRGAAEDEIRFFELVAVGVFQSQNVARYFDGGDLHAEAKAEIRHLVFARVFGRRDLAFDAALAEAA